MVRSATDIQKFHMDQWLALFMQGAYMSGNDTKDMAIPPLSRQELS